MPSLWKKLLRRKSINQIHEDLLESQASGSSGLTKNLGLLDLVCFGVAAIIGAGVFSTIGTAAANGGPAVTVLFVLTAIACLFSALCYAEFASTIPVSGSAYTYSYTAFGELIAWIIGWNLLMEYAIGNSTIAFSWSEYFTDFLSQVHIGGKPLLIADWLQNDYYTCSHAFAAIEAAKANGEDLAAVPNNAAKFAAIWEAAPSLGGLKIIFDLPALAINLLVTCLV